MNWLTKLFTKDPSEKTVSQLLSDIENNKIFFNPFLKYLRSRGDFNKYTGLGHYSIIVNLSIGQIQKLSPIAIKDFTSYSSFTAVEIRIQDYDNQYVQGIIPSMSAIVKTAQEHYKKLDNDRKIIIEELYRSPLYKIRQALYNNKYDKEFLKTAYELFKCLKEDTTMEEQKAYKSETESLQEDLDFIKKRQKGMIAR